eukprot:2260149-Prymnesium_polylepis.1
MVEVHTALVSKGAHNGAWGRGGGVGTTHQQTRNGVSRVHRAAVRKARRSALGVERPVAGLRRRWR